MFRPRVIPVLLLSGSGLVKSVRFKKHRYIGDPMNAVKLFNDLRADELVFLDIDATGRKGTIDPELVREVGEEANMPFGVGGGIRTLEQIQNLLALGAEKVVIGSEAVERPAFVREAADTFGSSTIAVCIDVKKRFLGKDTVWTQNAKKASKYSPVQFAQLMQQQGAGELIVQSVDRDGTGEGYHLELLKSITAATTIPVVALGGAGKFEDLHQAYRMANTTGLGAGSLFVYHGARRGVLINYPETSELATLRVSKDV